MAEPLNRDAAAIADRAGQLADEAQRLATEAADLAHRAAQADAPATDPVLFGLTVFALACFVGYYVVWKVTPALHAPLMSVANAISGVVVLGAMIAAGPAIFGVSKLLGFVAVVVASVNIFGGFIITQRMLQMYRKKDG
ncbi:MAG: NAD(P) transhydrogenase subunit alpha [Alphaproteobacteria bacterium]|nr:NAD(P) transhydrogenase subunit alpha [Alphaproteobacteria bacterium]